ncbi:hypothetical protein L917_06677 [Phytophthora nicotianae]|uniref:MULE transposase domain-containing protein n=1 Tax=Phytophthora nicotianae TaxID=4792 RepID=W2LFR7_PHYNI|nr:hypothetical protein L917_06677 [Phytophthora nicotianae]
MKIILQAVDKSDPTGEWKIVHTRNGSRLHNHPPSEDARVHPGHRQRAAASTSALPTASLQDIIGSQTAVGSTTARVHASLIDADPDSFVIPQDIANMRSNSRRHELATKTVMEAVFNRLESDGFYYRYELDLETQRVLYLFWAHPGTLEQYRLHCDVAGMDYRELAAMNAVSTVFPGVPAMICRWHMNKNVISKTRQVLGQVAVQNPAPGQSKYENTWQTDAFMSLFYRAVESSTEAFMNSWRSPSLMENEFYDLVISICTGGLINREQATTFQHRIQEPAFNEEESMSRRLRRRSRRICTLPYNTRRDPVFFERVDLNNPATPPASSLDRYQNAGTTVSVLNPVSTLPAADVQDPSVFHTSNVPPRFWGYARWS